MVKEVLRLNFNYLNKMIQYIEENLTNEINYNKLSKISNTNLFILERIFSFLTNMTLVEYIKKRRLSKAFEEIKNTDTKIIDIAFKYQYNSASSFNRAFKQLFNITPTECRKGKGNYKIIPIEYFENNKNNYNFDYEIKELDSKNLYCYHVISNNHSDLTYKIRQLYQDIRENGCYEIFNKIGMYGIFEKQENLYHYYLGTTQNISNLEKYKIKKNKYVVFTLMSRNQKDIITLETKINQQWIPSTNYIVKNNIKIELYEEDKCYIYLPIE